MWEELAVIASIRHGTVVSMSMSEVRSQKSETCQKSGRGYIIRDVRVQGSVWCTEIKSRSICCPGQNAL
jgi:hypothetical protein